MRPTYKEVDDASGAELRGVWTRVFGERPFPKTSVAKVRAMLKEELSASSKADAEKPAAKAEKAPEKAPAAKAEKAEEAGGVGLFFQTEIRRGGWRARDLLEAGLARHPASKAKIKDVYWHMWHLIHELGESPPPWEKAAPRRGRL